jgi:hypothetical protein
LASKYTLLVKAAHSLTPSLCPPSQEYVRDQANMKKSFEGASHKEVMHRNHAQLQRRMTQSRR